MSSFRVNSKMCSTCIFGANSIISPQRFAQLQAVWEADGVAQQCHQSNVRGGDTACRGHYEAYRRGKCHNHPLDAAASQIFEALGLVTFEDVP